MRTFRLLRLVAGLAVLVLAPVGFAAESRELELSGRVVKVTTELRNPGGALIAGSSMCPDQVHDIAIGGSCAAGGDAELKGDTLVSGLGSEAFWCRFTQPEQLDHGAAPLLVTVVCVRNAR